MLPSNIARYQAVNITTANPGDILVALLDGVFKFLRIAKHGFETKNRARAGDAIKRAHAIITELLVSLEPEHFPELCQNLAAIYDFCLFRLSHANRHNDVVALDDVMRVMAPIREAFTIAVKQLNQGPPLERTGSGG
ncbi:MAG TPA: flagellar export chaperone FliS [Polyangiaceae bacterium]|nr:flagellar export chaperone FliS [Polyangiaceae bacterium]